MRRLFLATAVTVILTACNAPATQFDEGGNYKRADEMQAAWCEYNEGRDFATKQCE